MIDVNKLKVGVTFTEDKAPWRVLKYDFIKMGRGWGDDQSEGEKLV